MSLILGLETATPMLSVAVVQEEGLCAARAAQGQRLSSVRLLPFIQEVLADAGATLQDLTGVAVSIGPGSFTGVRLGLTTAKTIAQVLGLPVAGVPTLLALAKPLLLGEMPVCPILISRREEVYAAVYTANGSEVSLLREPFAARPSEVAEQIIPFGRLILTGEGAWTFKKIFEAVLGPQAVFAPQSAAFPQASMVAELGLRELLAGRGTDALQVHPIYLRPPAITGGVGVRSTS